MGSKAYTFDSIPVLLPFGSHGEYRQIVASIDDAVLEPSYRYGMRRRAASLSLIAYRFAGP